LARGLAEACRGLPAPTAADLLREALDREQNPSAREALARGLAEVCRMLPEEQRREVLGKAADLLREALNKEKNASASEALARGLAVVCRGLPPSDGGIKLLQAMAQNPDLQEKLMFGPIEYPARCAGLVGTLVAAPEAGPGSAATQIHLINQHRDAVYGFRTLVSRLGKQDLQVLVDILKNPLCYGEARKVLLRRLELLTGQTFSTRWDAVAYLRAHHPKLDLDNPPALPRGYRD
jgi:hypothetical protein